jgi:plastocyanin
MSSKKFGFMTLMLVGLVIGSILLASCTRPGTSTASTGSSSSSSSSSSSGGNSTTVHLETTNFQVSSISIPKGSMLTVVDDVAVPHILKNGSWVNGNQVPKKESGAPTVNVSFSGNDTHQIGPFNTAGTYHIYCTIHTGMNLTINVK